MTTPEEDAQTAALQEYFDSHQPAGYGASFRAGWDAGKRWAFKRDLEAITARCPHGHLYCCGHHDLEDMPIHTKGECR